MNTVKSIVLAAGKGTRMRTDGSDAPKVMRLALGKPLLSYVLSSLPVENMRDAIVVVGYMKEQVMEAFPDCTFAVQSEQLGTGHAVMCAEDALNGFSGNVLICCGDTPLVTRDTYTALLNTHIEEGNDCTMLSGTSKAPMKGYGRVLHASDGGFDKIIEEKDCTPEEAAIQEYNSGIYIFKAQKLFTALKELKTDNAQGEYYLTDVIRLIAEAGGHIDTLTTADPIETTGVNDRVQLAEAAAALYRRKAQELMLSGVTIIDPANTYIDQQVTVGQDTIIYPGCQLRGDTHIGAGCTIDGDCIITDSVIGDNCTLTKCVLDQAEAASGANIGPFAYLRPGTRLGENVKIGDFAEVKNAVIGAGSKIPHLSYIGDAEVGSGVNIGCGAITCNYDGVNKHKTIIGDDVFIGSNTNLVAPVSVGRGAFVGAGSTITKEVAAGALAVERARQTEIAGWAAEKSPRALAKKPDGK